MDTYPSTNASRSPHDHAFEASTAVWTHVYEQDCILVPRTQVEHWLIHARAGYSRFPTRHIAQLITSFLKTLGGTER